MLSLGQAPSAAARTPECGRQLRTHRRVRAALEQTMTIKRIGRLVFLGAVSVGAVSACISPDSPLVREGSEGCDEFQPGQELAADVNVDPTVRIFMRAAGDFVTIADSAHSALLTACASIAADLGAPDTWSALDDPSARVSNEAGTGACDAAGRAVEDVLVSAGTVGAHIALAVSRGECRVDFDAQAECDAECAVNAPCDPGSVETRCEPGKLSVVCEASCSAEAHCLGRPDRPANCMGKCESSCVGECKGTCVHQDGRVTENDPNCMGKCASSCNGTCRGRCKVEQPVQCGTNVHCLGGCTSSFSDPVCTTEFTRPNCDLNAECHAACSAQVAANAQCDPPLVEVLVDLDANPELEPLVATLKANLPAVLSAAETHGSLALEAARRLGKSGEALSGKLQELSGKSLACLGESSKAVGHAIGRFDVTVRASSTITVTCRDGMQ